MGRQTREWGGAEMLLNRMDAAPPEFTRKESDLGIPCQILPEIQAAPAGLSLALSWTAVEFFSQKAAILAAYFPASLGL